MEIPYGQLEESTRKRRRIRTRELKSKDLKLILTQLLNRRRELSSIQLLNRQEVRLKRRVYNFIEFFSHGKVATMKLPESHKVQSPTKAAIKAKSLIKKSILK